MSSTVYDTSVLISLIDRASPGLAKLAMGFAKTQTAADALQKHLNKIKSNWQTGTMLLGSSAAIASPLIAATKSAMELETALGRVRMATGASNGQMEQLNQTLTKTANQTAIFSKPKLAAFAAEMYAGGIRSMGQINDMLPAFAKAADVLKITSGGKIGADSTIHSLTAISHQFGKYTAKEMSPIIEAAVAMSKSLPGGMGTLAKMGSYVNIMGNRALGIDPVQLMAMQAAVAQTSGGTGTGRGALSGANLANFLKRSMPGVFGAGLLSGKSAYAGAVMGLGDKYGASTVMKDGKLNLEMLQSKIAKFEGMGVKDIAKIALSHVDMLGKKAGEEIPLLKRALALGEKGVSKSQLITQMMQYMYGSASTIAMLAGDRKFLGIEQQLTKSANDGVKNGGIEKMQAMAMEMLEPQLLRLQTNFETLSSTIGMQLIPVITPMVKGLGDFVDKINDFASNNPKIVTAAASLVAMSSAALAVAGVVSIASAAWGALRFVLPVITKGLGPLGLAIAAVAIAVDNWDNIMKFVKDHQREFIHYTHLAEKAMRAVNRGLIQFGNGVMWLGNLIAGILSGLPAFKSMGDNLKKTMDSLRIDDETFKKDKRDLRKDGFGGLVDAIATNTTFDRQIEAYNRVKRSGGTDANASSLAGFAGRGATAVKQDLHYAPVYHITTGLDEVKLKKVLDQSQKDFHNYSMKQMSKAATSQARASSGNSVGSSVFAGGSGRS